MTSRQAGIASTQPAEHERDRAARAGGSSRSRTAPSRRRRTAGRCRSAGSPSGSRGAPSATISSSRDAEPEQRSATALSIRHRRPSTARASSTNASGIRNGHRRGRQQRQRPPTESPVRRAAPLDVNGVRLVAAVAVRAVHEEQRVAHDHGVGADPQEPDEDRRARAAAAPAPRSRGPRPCGADGRASELQRIPAAIADEHGGAVRHGLVERRDGERRARPRRRRSTSAHRCARTA